MPRKAQKTHSGKLPDNDKIIFDALRAVNGNVSASAKRLGVSHAAVHSWLSSEPTRRDKLAEIRNNHDDNILDLAVTALEKSLRSSDGRVRNKGIEIAMRYLGKKRGYVPASYVENENNGDVTVKVVRE